jgi:hypothetical protein
MKKHVYTLLFLILSGHYNFLQAQIITESPGSSLTIKSGTTFSADGITLTPSSDFTLSNINLVRNTTVLHPVPQNYISRVYLFNNITDPFSGTVQINYQDGELNGITESNLRLNVFEGTTWLHFNSNTNNTVSNYVISDPLSNISLNELTLASVLSPLPLSWRSFTAQKQNNNVLLTWSTASEQNTQNFIPQFSTDGINWTSIATIAAKGNSNAISNYNYVHLYPVKGINYYRIIQTDLGGRTSYSELRTVNFSNDLPLFSIVQNPVNNGILKVQLNMEMTLSLFSTDGKLLWIKQFDTGLQNIDVSKYAKGIYLLKGNNVSKKLIIQ